MNVRHSKNLLHVDLISAALPLCDPRDRKRKTEESELLKAAFPCRVSLPQIGFVIAPGREMFCTREGDASYSTLKL